MCSSLRLTLKKQDAILTDISVLKRHLEKETIAVLDLMSGMTLNCCHDHVVYDLTATINEEHTIYSLCYIK